MFFEGSFFFLKDSVNSLKSICVSDLKDQKLLVSAIKTRIVNNRLKIYLPGGLTNGEGSLPVAITTRIVQSGRLLMSNPDSCEIISKSDLQFLRRFFKNFFMSVQCKKPPFTRAMFTDGSKFQEQVLKRVTQGTFL